ncbi:MAG: Fe-S-containing hydro-lyase [Candidatus Hydrogenedentota bacterium]
MVKSVEITTPLDDVSVSKLKTGDSVLITGELYTARDAAHKRLVEAIEKNEKLPFDIKGSVIYYVGPSPTPPGKVIGSAGPTTSYRMDSYAPELMKLGMKGMIGKGMRKDNVREAIKKFKCIYFAAVGGAAALIAKTIKECKIIAYEDLGPEAINRLYVEKFPCVVVNDIYGGDLYILGIDKYRR